MSLLYHGKTMTVIDFHVHTFPDAVAPAAIDKLQKISGLTPFTDGTFCDTRQKLCDDLQIDHAVLLNIATAPRQQHTINTTAAELQREYGSLFTPFGSVHFEADDAIQELERIRSLGLKGIKLHPDYQGFCIDDERLFPIYEACEALGLIISFHAGWDCYSPDKIHARPEASRQILRRFPNLKVVLAHFGGLKLWDEVEQYLIGENVWLDTAMCATYADPIQIQRMILRHPPEKILLGSDCPWENPAHSIEFILRLDLSDAQKEAILGKNAQKLLGI